MSEDTRFDGMFMTVAQQARGIEPLLENLFSFLRRKTDFFAGASKEKIESLVLKVVDDQSKIHDRDIKKKELERQIQERKKDELKKKKEKEEKEKEKEEAKTSVFKNDDDIVELSDDGSFDLSANSLAPNNDNNDNSNNTSTKVELKEKQIIDTDDNNDDDDNDNEPAPEGNGGKTDTYIWTQSLSEVEMRVPIPDSTITRNVMVDMTNTKLKIGIKGGDKTVIIDGELHKRIVVDDSLWVIEPSAVKGMKDIVLTLQKDNKMEWWKNVILGDPEINTQKVQPENSKLGDLDAETRQTVEKMMFDQRQKAMGLPTADEMQKQEMMKKFMDAHPEMDFSKAKFT